VRAAPAERKKEEKQMIDMLSLVFLCGDASREPRVLGETF